jgi:hypothetical protein
MSREPVIWQTMSALQTRPFEVSADVPVLAVLPWLNRDAAERAARLMVERAGAPLQVLAVHDDLRIGPTAVWNSVIRHVQSPYFIYCAEDAFAGRYWLRFALQTMEKPGAGLLAFNDGKWFGQIAAFGLVRRTWLQPIYGGALFCAGYVHHYGDTELTLIARQQQALVYHPHALLLEVDFEKDRRPVDASDHALFRARSENGFDGLIKDQALRHCIA